MNTLFKITSIIISALFVRFADAQLLTNNGLSITIESGLQVTVQGDIQNENATSINNNGTIDLSGNWTNNAQSNIFGTSQGTVIFNGIFQNIGGSASTNFNNLVFQNGGTKSLLSQISTGGTYASPTGILDLGTSILNLNTKTLSVFNPSVNAITNTTGYILSEMVDNSSKINWTVNSNIGAHTIPFGNSSGIAIPFTFTLTSGNAGDVTVSTYPTNAANLPLPAAPAPVTHVHDFVGNDNSANLVDRFWQVDVSGTPVASLTFTYAPSENAANGNANMIAQRWVDPLAGWALPQTGQTNPTSQSVFVSNVTSFGPWAITTSQSPLPIVMLQFTAKAVDNNKVICNWTTATEINNDFFTVEKSKDGVHFTSAGIVDGSGNTNTPHDYTFTDPEPYSGISFYRIKQTDYNGSFSYSVIRQVFISDEQNVSIDIFPNPVIDFVTIYKSKEDKVQLTLTDASGEIISSQPMNASEAKLDLSHTAPGIYFIVITDDFNPHRTFKIIKQ